MKKAIFFICILLGIYNPGKTQTASNFSCNDCSSNYHDAFSDLDAGKVLVLVWVMPCSNCINGALTAQTEVQTANAANPGKVLYYLLDDYANTTCATLLGWATSNGVNSAIVMSNSLASMTAYGAAGMPKIVVLGGKNHDVFYNKNAPDFTAPGIRDAIQAALAVAPNAIAENANNNFENQIFPNPCDQSLQLKFLNTKSTITNIQVFNALQQCVLNQQYTSSEQIQINTAALANGFYEIRCTNGEQYLQKKILVMH